MEEPSTDVAPKEAFKMPSLPAMPTPPKPAKVVEKKTEPVAPVAAEPDTSNTVSSPCPNKVEVEENAALSSLPTEPAAPEMAAIPPVPSLKATPAQLALANSIPVPYLEPSWGGIPAQPYAVEMIKNGSLVETLPLRDKSFFVIGRLASCDIVLEHPSLSRYVPMAYSVKI